MSKQEDVIQEQPEQSQEEIIKQLADQVAQLNEDLRKLKQDNNALLEASEGQDKEFEELKVINSELQKELLVLRDGKAQSEESDRESGTEVDAAKVENEELAQLRKQNNDLNKALEASKEAMSALSEQLQLLQGDKASYMQEMQERNSQAAEKASEQQTTILTQSQEMLKSYADKIGQQNALIDKLMRENEKLNSTVNASSVETEGLKTEVAKLKAEAVQPKAAEENLGDELAVAADKEAAQKALEASKKEVELLKAQLKEQDQEVYKLKNDLQQSREGLNELREDMAQVEAQGFFQKVASLFIGFFSGLFGKKEESHSGGEEHEWEELDLPERDQAEGQQAQQGQEVNVKSKLEGKVADKAAEAKESETNTTLGKVQSETQKSID